MKTMSRYLNHQYISYALQEFSAFYRWLALTDVFMCTKW